VTDRVAEGARNPAPAGSGDGSGCGAGRQPRDAGEAAGGLDVALTYSGPAGWQLTKQPIYVGKPEDGYRPIPDHFAVTRGTDGRALGVVGHPGRS
jgi:hypothetical protein